MITLITVKISKDISKQKSKMFWGLTARQMLFTGIAIGFSILVNCVLKINSDIKPFITIVLSIPFILCGWVNINGLPFEKYALLWLRNNSTNKERVFINESLGDYIKNDKSVNKRGKR